MKQHDRVGRMADTLEFSNVALPRSRFDPALIAELKELAGSVTRYHRVVFYDYDEIENLTDCNFRDIPPAPSYEADMASEPQYSVSCMDVFPEEFSSYLLSTPRFRTPF